MQFRNLGRTSLKISSMAYGNMFLSLGGRPNENESIKLIQAALDQNINLLDTADVYCLNETDIGYGERLINSIIKDYYGTLPFIVATKGGMERPEGKWKANGRPDHLKRACESSLKALGVDCIDIYQLHQVDDKVPFEESVGCLKELKESGKIRAIGLSNVSLNQIQRACRITDIISIQNQCNLYDPIDFHEGVIDFCEQENITYLAYSPLCSKKYHHLIQNSPIVLKTADKYAANPFQIAIAWLLNKSSAIVPILGTTKLPNLLENLASEQILLKKEDILQLDEVYKTLS